MPTVEDMRVDLGLKKGEAVTFKTSLHDKNPVEYKDLPDYEDLFKIENPVLASELVVILPYLSEQAHTWVEKYPDVHLHNFGDNANSVKNLGGELEKLVSQGRNTIVIDANTFLWLPFSDREFCLKMIRVNFVVVFRSELDTFLERIEEKVNSPNLKSTLVVLEEGDIDLDFILKKADLSFVEKEIISQFVD